MHKRTAQWIVLSKKYVAIIKGFGVLIYAYLNVIYFLYYMFLPLYSLLWYVRYS